MIEACTFGGGITVSATAVNPSLESFHCAFSHWYVISPLFDYVQNRRYVNKFIQLQSHSRVLLFLIAIFEVCAPRPAADTRRRRRRINARAIDRAWRGVERKKKFFYPPVVQPPTPRVSPEIRLHPAWDDRNHRPRWHLVNGKYARTTRVLLPRRTLFTPFSF